MKKIKCINSKTDSNKMRRKTLIFYLVRLCFLMIFVVSTTISYAQIKLPAFFGNNMVLQQNTQALVCVPISPILQLPLPETGMKVQQQKRIKI